MARTIDVTVITPTISGREELLEECMASVDAQTMKPAKHLIGLDKNLEGPAVIRNRLAKEVDTEWIAFLDDDDLLMPNHFEIHNTYMRDEGWDFGHGNLELKLVEDVVADQGFMYDVISSWCMLVDDAGDSRLFDTAPHIDRIMENHNSLPVTATVRTSTFRSVGGFSARARFEDMALWQSLIAANAEFKAVYIPTWYYRVHPNSRNSKE